jgi:hypothetical protein
MDVME